MYFNNLIKLWEKRNKFPKVIYYHGIEKDIINTNIQSNQLKFSTFKEQIKLLRDLKKRFVSLSEIDYLLKNTKDINGNEVSITFDDGYENNYQNALPFLNDNNIPSSIFICPNLIENNKMIPTFYIRSIVLDGSIKKIDIEDLKISKFLSNYKERVALMNLIINYIKNCNKVKVDKIINQICLNISNDRLSEVKEIYKSEKLMDWNRILIIKNQVEIGSHTLDHCILHSSQSKEEVKSQIVNSKIAIEEKIGKCKYFAYPNGSNNFVSIYAKDIVKRNYKIGFLADGRAIKKFERSSISRLGVSNYKIKFLIKFSILD